eukprot:s3431_g2.t1
MSYVDSEVVFKARCDEIKLSETTFGVLKAKGWSTFGSYAFSVSTNPAQITDQDFDSKVAVPVLGSAVHAEAAILRRLLFESYTLTATELRRKTDTSEADGPKKLPVQEISSRFDAIEKKLSPLKIESVLEPSHALINALAQCSDDGRLRYIEWSKCNSRSMELNNMKEQNNLKVWKADSSGAIKLSEAESSLKCDVGTELEVLNALKRRGVAYEISKLMSYEVHERIIQLLFGELQREPLEGFKRPTLSQLSAADREVHLRLAELTRSGLPLGPGGELPLDKHVEKVLEMPSVMWLLMQKPRAAVAERTVQQPSNATQGPKKDQNKVGSPDRRKPSRNGKFDKNKRKPSKTPMPLQLRGGTPVDSDGRAICYGYNRGTCHDKGKLMDKLEAKVSSCMAAESRSSVAQATEPISPSVDVIQGKPVSTTLKVEGPQVNTNVHAAIDAADPSEGLANATTGPKPHGCFGADSGKKPPPFLLELFCGTAGVCAQFRLLGGKAIGVDHHLKRSKLKAAAVKLDLTQVWVQELIEREIVLGRISAVHLGPPCGTASKARNIPVKRKLRRSGAPNPRPLRSERCPLGFPWLKGINRDRVQAANCLYKWAAKIIELCDAHSIPFTLENPQNSLLWITPYFRPLMQKYIFHIVDACEFGSDHKKSTAFLANFEAPRLRLRCSGKHTHKPWTIQKSESGEWQFDTAKEAEYPVQLAKAVAASFIDHLLESDKFQLQDELQDHAVKISAHSQPRRTRGPLLLSEFKAKVSISCNSADNPPEIIPEDAQFPWQGVPVGSKRIECQPDLDGKGDEGGLKVTYGVYFTPEEFMDKVRSLKHPFDIPLQLDEANMSSISFILTEGPSRVAKFRTDTLKHYVARARALQPEEDKLHASLDADVRHVMSSKRLLLFREMMRDAGVQDTALFDEMCNGFKLVGDLQPSGQFGPQWRPAALGVEQLKQTAMWAQKAVVASCGKHAEDPEVAASVWNETLEQAAADKCWVKGPFTAQQITDRQGPHWIPPKRFGVRQGGKIRPVDDFSQYLINSTVTCHEKIDLEGIDNICATARFFLGAASNGDWWQLPTCDDVLTGAISKTWPKGECLDLFGRCLDLKQAYKQLARHPTDSWAAILAVLNPEDGEVYFFEAVALPFGSISSVMAFNRAARALRSILSRIFKLVVTNFFDDFCQMELGLLNDSAWKTAELVMDLLGWKISTGEDKRRPFAKTFEILGAVISFPEQGNTSVRVSNKDSRLEQIKSQVQELRDAAGLSLPRSKLESLKGRLIYAAGHTYGRCTQLACQLLHRFGGMGPSVQISNELVYATSEALTLLLNAKPRIISAWDSSPPVLIFTDGAVEEDMKSVTHGALLLDPLTGKAFYFGDEIPEEFCALWKRSGKKQVIAQAEIFPVLIAKETWKEVIDNRSVLWFLDNDSARMALIRNFSPVLDNFCLLQLNARLDVDIQARHWYNRVPSKSNPSDAASRLDFSTYTFASKSFPIYDAAFKSLKSFQELLKLVERG